MEENKTTYVLYLYNGGILKKFPGASKGKQYYNSEGDAIKGAQQHFKNLKNVFYTEQHKKCVQEMQALIVKYTNSYESRIVGILENRGTTYTKLQGLANPEDLKTRII